jgi:small subunit ribosomal protein S18
MVSKQQKTSPISINQKIDYKDIDLLTLFVTEQKILPRRTGVTVQQQRKLAKAIKRARVLALFLLLHRTLFKTI